MAGSPLGHEASETGRAARFSARRRARSFAWSETVTSAQHRERAGGVPSNVVVHLAVKSTV